MSQEEFIKSMADTWGLGKKEREVEIKKARIHDLLKEVTFPPFEQFFDPDSDNLLDEKIEVLTALRKGKSIADIPNFYGILERYPQSQEQDKIALDTHWD